jgi:hypothetical protein
MRLVTVSPIVRLLIAGGSRPRARRGRRRGRVQFAPPATPPTPPIPAVRPASLAPHGTAVAVGRCSRRVAAQQWTVTGGTVRDGNLCLAAAPSSSRPAVSLSTCGGGAGQTWTAYGQGQLKNAATGRCLDDPRASRHAGTVLRLARTCRQVRAKTWWLP